ncbi:MAG: hypothetical protein OEZ58_09725 [Gammaproteobacteria bacterium]|nr:hypothetical protein [Gammaproteobacteria bacterium]MDH5729257.1 hypothetical protein [Gammaproteobacteria bacterium]
MIIEKQQLDQLLAQSFEAYKEELKKPWPEMETDLDKAFEIIALNSDSVEQHQVSLVDEIHINEHGEQVINFPAWQDELERHLKFKYGQSKGQVAFNKVIMQIFLRLRQNQPALH